MTLTREGIQAVLVEIAQLESEDAQDALAALETARDYLYDVYLERVHAQILVLKMRPVQLRDDLKAQFLEYVEMGGDPHIHDCIEFRHTTSFEYDKKDALQFVLDNELPYTRTKVELDANAFKKACRDGVVNYPAGETVNAPTVAIGMLGHLLITHKEK